MLYNYTDFVLETWLDVSDKNLIDARLEKTPGQTPWEEIEA